MKLLHISIDKLAISLSMLCALHCLAFPLLVALLPSIAALPLEQETFHLWMVMAVIPTSIYALTLGCKKHKKLSVLLGGLIGLAGMIAAVILGESLMGEMGEKLLTLAGASLIALTHYKNFQLCHRLSECPCPDSKGGSGP